MAPLSQDSNSVSLSCTFDFTRSWTALPSARVPPFVRRSARVTVALPWLYVKGISTGEMREALTVLVGDQVRGLSPNVVSRLKGERAAEYAGWMKRDLSASRYIYWWADGIHIGLRQENDARQCLLVIILSLIHISEPTRPY